jgi:hypothetical protein
VKDHLLRFTRIYEQLTAGQLDEEWLKASRVAGQPLPGRGLPLLDLVAREWQTPERERAGNSMNTRDDVPSEEGGQKAAWREGYAW